MNRTDMAIEIAAPSILKENPAGMTSPTTSFEQPKLFEPSMERGIIVSDEAATKTNRISSLKYSMIAVPRPVVRRWNEGNSQRFDRFAGPDEVRIIVAIQRRG